MDTPLLEIASLLETKQSLHIRLHEPEVQSIICQSKLRKPPDKIHTNNNQIIPLFLSIKFNLIQMNPVNAIFLSEGETQSTFWKLTQRKSLGNINTTTIHLKKFAVSLEEIFYVSGN
jgi:hypothetical protein